ncbi:MAG: NapH/MauN family ferredoxin-type protein [Proteobacteria bacterium]|nr:NapH/MauN family ferredoxin-type protein [Pseudomonadota bacterium]
MNRAVEKGAVMDKPKKIRVFKGPGKRKVAEPVEGHSYTKWKRLRWFSLIFFNFLFFASFYFDIQILEGSLSASRLLGFHMIDPFAALQVILASKLILPNLVIGTITITIIYIFIGGRSFCSWICPYHLLAELGESIHQKLVKKKIIKNHTFDPKIKYVLFALSLILSFGTGYTVFEVINPVSALSRFFVYGPGILLAWVLILLLVEVFYSRRAWCRYFCPVGVSYNLIGMISPTKIKYDLEKCSNCKDCQRVCMVPHVLIDTVSKGRVDYVTNGDCTRCGLCIDVCADEALGFSVRYLDKIM